jgi:hypothetical protein
VDGADITRDSPIYYEIRVRGAFDQTWRDLAEDMTLDVIQVDSQPVNVMRVLVQDQAKLAGLLDALFALNATVLSVTTIGAEQGSVGKPDRGHQ